MAPSGRRQSLSLGSRFCRGKTARYSLCVSVLVWFWHNVSRRYVLVLLHFLFDILVHFGFFLDILSRPQTLIPPGYVFESSVISSSFAITQTFSLVALPHIPWNSCLVCGARLTAPICNSLPQPPVRLRRGIYSFVWWAILFCAQKPPNRELTKLTSLVSFFFWFPIYTILGFKTYLASPSQYHE
jgi:hypothetical protein